MDREKCIEIFNKEIDSLMKHRHDSDFMLHHGERTEKMIDALIYAIKVLEEMSGIRLTKELAIDKELKEKFKNERNDEVKRHIEAVKTWREKSFNRREVR